MRAFTDLKNKGEKVEDSTTVVTVRCSKGQECFEASLEKFSFDFVIISIDEEKRLEEIAQVNILGWNCQVKILISMIDSINFHCHKKIELLKNICFQ